MVDTFGVVVVDYNTTGLKHNSEEEARALLQLREIFVGIAGRELGAIYDIYDLPLVAAYTDEDIQSMCDNMFTLCTSDDVNKMVLTQVKARSSSEKV